MKRGLLLLGNLLLVLAVVNVAIARKELTATEGRRVYLRLRPVDPRSLMQGDYMRLEYAMARAIEGIETWPRDGLLVVRVEPDETATFVRRFAAGEALGADEIRLRYRLRGDDVRIGSDAWYFEEGQADAWTASRYAELRVDAAGDSVLVNMRDEAFVPLGPGLLGD